MHRTDTPAWSLRTGFPVELQFAAFVGQREGFAPSGGAMPHTGVAADWDAWWEGVPLETFSTCIARDARASPELPPHALLQRAASRASLRYDPPTFARCGLSPALHALCVRHWPAFHTFWEAREGEKARRDRHTMAAIRRVRANRIVTTCMRAAGKGAAAPFALILDFVWWPDRYERRLATDHLVLDAHWLDAGMEAAYRAKLTELITPLV